MRRSAVRVVIFILLGGTWLSVSASEVDPEWLSQVEENLTAAEYQVSWQDDSVIPGLSGAYQAPNRANNLRSYFLPEGVRITKRTTANAAWWLGLDLVRVGNLYVDPAALSPRSNSILCDRPGAHEAWINEPAGLRAIVELNSAPNPTAPLELHYRIEGTARAIVTDDRRQVRFIAPGGRTILTWGPFSARDALGDELEVSLRAINEAGRRTLVLTLSAEDAVAPLTVTSVIANPSDADWEIQANQDEARMGSSPWGAASAGDVNGDGYGDIVVGVPLYDNGTTDEGVVLVFHGSATGITASDPSGADAFIESNTDGVIKFGSMVGPAGDVNGDGYDDIITSAFLMDGESPSEDDGAAYIYHGSAAGITGTDLTDADATIVSGQAGANLGRSVCTAGDVNMDGYADVLIAAYFYDSPGYTDDGAVFVFHGSAAGITGTDPGTADTVIVGQQDSRGLGWAAHSAGDVNGDGYSDIIVGATNHSPTNVNEGAAYVFHGSASGITGTNPSNADATLVGDQAGGTFMSASGAGDVNGDGYADVAVGAYKYNDGETNEGHVFIFHGSASGISSGGPGTADGVIQPNQNEARFGWSVGAAGDFNGDGYGDIVAGAYNYSYDQIGTQGGTFVFLGSAEGITAADPSDAALAVEGQQNDMLMGYTAAGAGDINGDGLADIITSACLYDDGQTDEGAVFIFHGHSDAPVSGGPDQADLAMESNQAEAHFGWSVATAGDVNADGYTDIVVGARDYDSGQDNEGIVVVFHGSANGIEATTIQEADAFLEGNQTDADFGFAAASAGDVNGDGYGDIIIGSILYDDDFTDEGAAFIYYGSAAGITGTEPADADAVLTSDQEGANLGMGVASAGDVNGDGFSDVIVGAPFYDAGQNDEGAAFIFYGSGQGITGSVPSEADAVIESDQAEAYLGSQGCVASVGDVNGDGYGDIVVSAYRYANPENNEGAAFVFHGSATGISGGNSAQADTVIEANAEGSYLGRAAAGDVNGDGYSDLIISAFIYDRGQVEEGIVMVFHGSASGITGSDPSTADSIIESDEASSYLGTSVAAGDVNGDGFADVVAVAQNYDGAGGEDSGIALLYLGSDTGIADGGPLSADAIFDPEQAGALTHGCSMADVNGDGYADVLIGARHFDGSSQEEGLLMVFHGNGGNDGRFLFNQQFSDDGANRVVQPWGSSRNTQSFKLRAAAASPLGRERFKLEIEACPQGLAFDDPGCTTATSATWRAPTAGDGEILMTQTVSGLSEDTLYHWRYRVLTAPYSIDQGGVTAPPNPRHGPWHRLGSQVVDADIRTANSSQTVTLKFTAAASSVNEEDGATLVSVLALTSDGEDLASAVTVDADSLNDSAVGGVDFGIVDETLLFAAGSADGSSRAVTVTVTSDEEWEEDESFSIVLSSPSAGGQLGATSSHQITIVDDDMPYVDLAVVTDDTADPVVVSEQVVYVSTVTNFGPDPATNLSFTDTIPAGSSFVGVSQSGFDSCSQVSGVVTCTLSNLDLVTQPTVSVTVQAPAAPGTMTNSTSVVCDQTDPVAGNSSWSEPTQITSTTQNQALQALYTATTGSSWDRNDNWTVGDPCSNSWYGVTCTNGLVSALSLSANNLDGSLPSELGALGGLQYLYLDDNLISGSLPASLGDLDNLIEFTVGENSLTGSIPTTFGNWPAAEILDLHSNRLDGALPDEITALGNLRELYLHDNQLSSALPVELGQLSSLVNLDLGFNSFTGSIPTSINHMTELEYLNLRSNRLSGPIPAVVGDLANLTILFLDGNALSGEIPSNLVNLTSILPGWLDLRWNGLYSSDHVLVDFLNVRQLDEDFEGTQTIAPIGVTAETQGTNTVLVSWTPISYTGNDGGYEVYERSSGSAGPFKLEGTTVDKTVSSMTVEGLNINSSYEFEIKAVTFDHVNNPGLVESAPSTRVTASTAPSSVPGRLQFSIDEYRGSEGQSKIITVRRLGGSAGAASVQFATSNGSAGAADYGAASGTLNWSANDDDPKTFQVLLTDDGADEGDETVNLTLSNATGASLGSPLTAVLHIQDNDFHGDTPGTTNGVGHEPVIASNPDGDRVVVWQEEDRDGAGTGIFFQRYNPDGDTVGGHVQVNQNYQGDQHSPAVDMADDGSFVVCWIDDEPFVKTRADGDGIFGRSFSATGIALTNEIGLNTTSLNRAAAVQCAVEPTGDEYVATWQGQESVRADGDGIFGRVIGKGGTPVSIEMVVADGSVQTASNPDVAVNDSGNSVITWAGEDINGSLDIWAQTFNSSGSATGTARVVNEDTWLDQNHSAVVMRADGSYVVAWHGPSLPRGGGDREPGTDVFVRPFSSSQVPTGPSVRINESESSTQRKPRITTTSSGDCFVSWEHEGSDGLGRAFARRLTGCTTPKESELELNVAGGNSVRSPDIAASGTNEVIAVYAEDDVIEGDGSIIGRAFFRGLFSDDFESGGTSNWSVTTP